VRTDFGVHFILVIRGLITDDYDQKDVFSM